MIQTVILRPDNARERMAYAWRLACAFLELSKPVKVTVQEALNIRTLMQNAKLHATCGDLAVQKKWDNRFIDTEGWKRLLVDAWAREEGREQSVIVPSLDFQSIVTLHILTRHMPVNDMADLITFSESWCANNDVVIHG